MTLIIDVIGVAFKGYLRVCVCGVGNYNRIVVASVFLRVKASVSSVFIFCVCVIRSSMFTQSEQSRSATLGLRTCFGLLISSESTYGRDVLFKVMVLRDLKVF